LKGALCLLWGGDAKNVFQLMVHLVHLIGRGCKQSIQKHNYCGHSLAGPGEGGAQRHLTVYGSGDVPCSSSGVGEVDRYDPLCLMHELAVVYFGQLGLNGRSLVGDFTSPVCGPMLNVCLPNVGLHLLLLLIGF
jgi:hypothetical protein